MNPQKRILLWINLLGGAAVVGSYILGLATHPGQVNALWGSVPQVWRTLSTASMLPAALGFIVFTLFIFFCVDPETVKISLRGGFKIFHWIYLLILVPSALWMPLTFAYLAHPGAALWWTIRLALFLVGLGGLLMFAALLGLQPRKPAWAFWLAVAGCIFFCIQTVGMDALAWGAFFLPV